MKMNCSQACGKYLERKRIELEGCSEDYKMQDIIFSTFNHLSVYFPEAYEHMLKVWEINEDI